jgi:phenylacetate-CoA ligase
VKERFIYRRLVMPCARLDEEMLESYVRRLQGFRPRVLRGYTNSLYALARYMVATGREVPLAAVVSAAEPLYPFQRPVIEEAFGAPLFEQYGSREAGLMATECEVHRGLHVDAASIIIEIVKREEARFGGNGSPASGEGELLVTDLFNYGMPLIRYAIGDVGRWDGNGCRCGSGLPLLAEVAGRVTDSILTPDGGLVSGAALTVYLVEDRPGFKQLQVVQERLERVKVRIVPSNRYEDADLDFLRAQLRRFLGDSMEVECEFVSEIGRERSGKYRYVISHLGSGAPAVPGPQATGERREE